MPTRRPPSRSALLVAALMAMATLPGCLTPMVWEGHGDDGAGGMPTAARVALTPLAVTGDVLVGALVVVAVVGPYGVQCACCCR